jgi:hypothetical protein
MPANPCASLSYRKRRQPDRVRMNVALPALIVFFLLLPGFIFRTNLKLDRLVLQNVVRRPITADKVRGDEEASNRAHRFYDVDGDSFVLRYNEAITLNIQYARLRPVSDSVPP